jgi:hypothetical protein
LQRYIFKEYKLKIRIFLSVLLAVSLNANSEVVTKEGFITQLLVDSELSSSPGTWFTVDSLTTAGDCKVSGGRVIVYIENDEQGKRQYSLALAAKASKQRVLVRVDSSVKHPQLSDRCMLKYIAWQN